MKRPIEFTAKRIDTGEWVVGFPLTNKLGTYIITEKNPHECPMYGYIEINDYKKVDPETVSQFTGRKLAKGNKVYEGTIAFIEKEHNFGDERTYVVCVWIDEWSMWAWLEDYELRNYNNDGVEGLDADLFWSYTMIDSEKFHYAGNIFDRPELMKPTL